MTEIMLPVRPKWCELIASGKKTIEVRKFCLKCGVPFKVDIYCTDDRNHKLWIGEPINDVSGGRYLGNGKVIGEFVCRNMTCIQADIDIRGDKHLYNTAFFGDKTCLSDDELFDYIYSAPDKTGWGWWISDLKIYDEPKSLSEFWKANVVCHRGTQKNDCDGCWDCEITRPPQCFCYVERRD